MMLFTCLPPRRRIRRPTLLLGEPVPLRGSTPEALRLRWTTPKSPALRVCAGPLPKVTAKPPATKTASGKLHPKSHSRTFPNHRASTAPLRRKRHGVTKHLRPHRQVEASLRPSNRATSSIRSRTIRSRVNHQCLPAREFTMAWNLTGVLALSVALCWLWWL